MTLEQLLARARKTQMTEAEREAQRQSFAYGNTHFENENITRDTVERASQRLKEQADVATEQCSEQLPQSHSPH
jgi:hypothetical protein